jgi:hypothetical protein
MTKNSLFGNLNFGAVKGAHFSHLGVAVRNAEGTYVSYDKTKGEIVNVDLIDFQSDNMLYSIPVALKDIAVGDVVVHNGSAVFVTGKQGNDITVVDVSKGEKKTILPTKSMFGFDFVNKYVSLIDFSGVGASADAPFGNLLPMMMLANADGASRDSFLPLMLMSQGNGSFDMSNPLMLYALMGNGGSESKDFFLAMMLSGQMGTSQAATQENSSEKV